MLTLCCPKLAVTSALRVVEPLGILSDIACIYVQVGISVVWFCLQSIQNELILQKKKCCLPFLALQFFFFLAFKIYKLFLFGEDNLGDSLFI